MTLDFLFLRSYGTENAPARLQSDPLITGLRELGYTTELIQTNLKTKIQLPRQIKWIIAHYDDYRAIILAHKIKAALKCKIACLTSDIYRFDQYVSLENIVDLFVAPTDLHRRTLQYALKTTVIYTPECIDPIAYTNSKPDEFLMRSNNICWFGYPESFDKSLIYVTRLLKNDKDFDFRELTFITKENTRLHELSEHLTFSPSQFFDQTKFFGYSLLSHFPYDGSINTYIKSPNKLITSIVRGLIPIASDTENYSIIANRLGIENCLCRSPLAMVEKIKAREYERDFESYKIDDCRNALLKELTPKNISEIFLKNI